MKWLRFALAGLVMMFAGTCVQAEERPMEGVVLRVSLDPQSAPISYIVSDFAHPIGMDVDIIMELSKRLGFTLEDDRFYVLDRVSSIECLKKGIVDVLAGGMATTDQRREIMSFSPVYFQTGLGILYSKRYTEGKMNLGALTGKKVAVVRGSPAQTYLESIFGDMLELVPIPNLTLGYFMVAYGDVAALVHDFPLMSYFAETMPSLELGMSEDIFSLESGQIALGYAKDFKYKMEMSMGLREMMSDGTMQQLIDKWIRD